MIDSGAKNPEYTRGIQRQAAAVLAGTPYHTLELPGGRVIQGVVPLERLHDRLDRFAPLRAVRGKRILDIGAASGWNSFELEKRGASVVALDCVRYPEFEYAKAALGSNVELVILDADEISKNRLGTFDFVVCFGVLYHLRHPLWALEKICSITKEMAFVESYVIDGSSSVTNCVMEFYETNELGGQMDNWWGPSVACLAALCRAAGFGSVEKMYTLDRRAGLVCRRYWREPELTDGEGPFLCFAVNNRHQDDCFSPSKDEYISLTFRYSSLFDQGSIFVEVDGLAVPALSVVSTGQYRWQVDVRVPPGLELGSHAVRLRVAGSNYSNTRPIWMVPFEIRGQQVRDTGSLARTAAITGVGPDRNIPLVTNSSAPMPVYFDCAGVGPEPAESVIVEIDGAVRPIAALGFLEEGVHQANCVLSPDLAPGWHSVCLRLPDGSRSNSMQFWFEPRGICL